MLSGHPQMNGGAVAATAVKIAAAKTSLPFAKAFVAGILCNLLVCMPRSALQAPREQERGVPERGAQSHAAPS